MYSQNKPFQQRIAQVDALKLGAKAKGARVLYEKRPDGLLVPVVTQEKRRFPWGALVLAAVCMIALKGFIYAYFGVEMLEARVADLSAGTGLDKVFAFLLQPDRLSMQAAQWLAPLLPEFNAGASRG